MASVEVVAWFAGTLVDVARVAPGGSYRIGSAAGVELPIVVPGLTCFPIVGTTATGFVVRCPAGIAALVDGQPRPELAEVPLLPATRVELRFGSVTVQIALAGPDRAVPRPGVDARPYLYGAVSLALHVAIWLVAMTRAPLARLPFASRLQPVHVTRIPDEPPPVPPPKPAAPQVVAAGGSSPPRGARGARPGVHVAAEGWAALHDLRAITGHADVQAALADVGPIYDEAAANQGNFGNAQRFDPTQCPDCGTIASGAYGTVATGRGAGDGYFPGQPRPVPVIGMCPANRCDVVGGTPRETIDRAVKQHHASLAACFHENPSAGEVIVAFTIGDDGVVRESRGRGLAGVSDCVARILTRMKFAAAPTTHVTYAVSFRPA